MLGEIFLAREGVSDTTTTFGLDIRCWLSMAFLMQRNAACKALMDLKKDRNNINELNKSYEKVQMPQTYPEKNGILHEQPI